MLFLLRQVLGEMWSLRMRVLLAVLAVAWGTAVVILLLAFGEGLRRQVILSLLNSGERTLVISAGQTSRAHLGLPTGRIIRLVEEDQELLSRSVPGIARSGVSYGRWGSVVESEHLRTSTFVEGASPSFEQIRHMHPQAGGRFLSPIDVAERRRVAFLGDSIAGRLFPGQDPVGKSLRIDGVPFSVVGVLVPKLQISSINGHDLRRIVIPATTFRARYGTRHVSHILVQPEEGTSTIRLKDAIYRTLGERYRFDPDDPRALTVRDTFEEEQSMRRIVMGIQAFLGLIGVLTLVVAGVGVANVMFANVQERTREVGVHRAVGARRAHVRARFLVEALLITLSGGALGLLVSGGVVAAVRRMPHQSAAMEYLGNPHLSWTVAGLTAAVLVSVGVFAGAYPANRAAELDPADSLRYE